MKEEGKWEIGDQRWMSYVDTPVTLIQFSRVCLPIYLILHLTFPPLPQSLRRTSSPSVTHSHNLSLGWLLMRLMTLINTPPCPVDLLQSHSDEEVGGDAKWVMILGKIYSPLNLVIPTWYWIIGEQKAMNWSRISVIWRWLIEREEEGSLIIIITLRMRISLLFLVLPVAPIRNNWFEAHQSPQHSMEVLSFPLLLPREQDWK